MGRIAVEDQARVMAYVALSKLVGLPGLEPGTKAL